MGFRLTALNFFLRHVEKRHLDRDRDIVGMRRRFLTQSKYLFRDPPFALYLPTLLEYGGAAVSGLWAQTAQANKQGIILYFHGGAYVGGAPDTHRAMLARLSGLTGLAAVLPAYRLAPEHPFPAATEDALTAYCALLARGYRPETIVLGGDSAGGGLMLVLLHLICARDLPMPGAAFAFSPWTDLMLTGASIRRNARADPLLPAERIRDLRDMYLAGADPADPLASPLFGTFAHAPAILIKVGDNEILLDDSKRMAANLRDQGVEIRLEIGRNLPHVWPIFQGFLPEADKALDEVAAFINALI